jgi:hypothetical protein
MEGFSQMQALDIYIFYNDVIPLQQTLLREVCCMVYIYNQFVIYCYILTSHSQLQV